MAITAAEILVKVGITEDLGGLSHIESQLEKFGSKMTSAGVALTAGITAPLAGIATAALTAFSGFEKGMNRVSALGDITGNDLKSLEQIALDLGAKTQFSAKQAADGMGELAAQGFKAKDIMAGMPGVLALAAAGEISVAQAAESASTTLKQWGMDTSQLGMAVDVMAKAAASGSLNINDLNMSMKYVGPVAHAAGLTFHETAAAITLLADAGIKADQAGTALRMGLLRLTNPPKKAAEELEALGVQIKDAQGNVLPLANIIEQLQRGTAGMGGADKIASIGQIFGAESATAWIALIDQGAVKLRNLTTELVNSQGAAQRMSETLQKGMGGAWEKMMGSIETAAITLGKALAPAAIQVAGFIEQAANAAAKAAEWFGKLPVPVQATVIGIAALAAAIGPMLIVFGGMASGLSSIIGLFTPLGISAAGAATGMTGAGTAAAALAPLLSGLGIGLVAVAAGFAGWYVFEEASGYLSAFYEAIVGGQFSLTGFAEQVASLATTILSTLVPGFSQLATASQSVRDEAASIAHTIISTLVPGFDQLVTAAQSLPSNFERMIEGMGGWKTILVESIPFIGNFVRALHLLNDGLTLLTGKSAVGEQLINATAKAAQEKTQAMMKISDQALQAQLAHSGLAEKTNAATAAANAHATALRAKVPALKAVQSGTTAAAEATEKWGKAVARVTEVTHMGNIMYADHAKHLRNIAQLQLDLAAGKYDPKMIDAPGLITPQIDWSKVKPPTGLDGIGMDDIMSGPAPELRNGEPVGLQALEKQKTIWTDIQRVVNGTFDRIATGMTDAILSGKGFGAVLGEAWKELKAGLLDTLMHSILDPLKEGLTSMILGGKNGGGLLGGIFSGLGGKLSGWLGGLFGGGGAGGGSGLTGSLISTGVSAGSDLLGAGGSLLSTALSFLGPEAKQEATLNQIERNTAAGSIHLQHILDQGNLYWPKLESINMFLWDILAPSFASLMTTVEGIHEFLKPDEFGIAGMQPVVVAALVADDANMEIFARRLNEILRNQGG